MLQRCSYPVWDQWRDGLVSFVIIVNSAVWLCVPLPAASSTGHLSGVPPLQLCWTQKRGVSRPRGRRCHTSDMLEGAKSGYSRSGLCVVPVCGTSWISTGQTWVETSSAECSGMELLLSLSAVLPVCSGPALRHRARAASQTAPRTSCQLCVFREMQLAHKLGLLWKFGSVSPPPAVPVAATAGSCACSCGQELSMALLRSGDGILGISAGLRRRCLQSGPNQKVCVVSTAYSTQIINKVKSRRRCPVTATGFYFQEMPCSVCQLSVEEKF